MTTPNTSTGGTNACRLILEDGSVFRGWAFGAVGRGVVSVAEVVFNTAMTGYQESLTDPSYSGQILVQTTPLIGNTGVNAEDAESRRIHVAGYVVRELARRHSNYRASDCLSAYLADQGILGIWGVDTRALTRRLRTAGVMRGALTDAQDPSDEELLARVRAAPSMAGRNLVPGVATAEPGGWEHSRGPWGRQTTRDVPPMVWVVDCGVKSSILRHLADEGCVVRTIPPTTGSEEILRAYAERRLHGLVVSNGPGDPAAVEHVVGTLREVLAADSGLPILGICLGHQMLCLAAGASTYKLPFGHRGANQPVRDERTGRVEITSQNHGFAVDEASLLAAGGEVTHRNLNDGTVAGFTIRGRPVWSVQHHPEASPGPHDAELVFQRFLGEVCAGGLAESTG